MTDILAQIVAEKHAEVAAAKARVPEREVRARLADAPPARPFAGALAVARLPSLIAEIKRRSPSAGAIRPDLSPVEVADSYARGGAAALSILTDGPHFGGSLATLAEVRAVSPLPILRKEFIVDPYQVAEARAHGADAVLLIAGVLDADGLRRHFDAAAEAGLDVLVEVHNEAELGIVAQAGLPLSLLGINNRDLKRQVTDLATFERLAAAARGLCPFLVAESGLRTAADVARMAAAGASALLVGESLLRERDIGSATRALLAGGGAR
jgi:indole-3-glycerol phosphate synthase